MISLFKMKRRSDYPVSLLVGLLRDYRQGLTFDEMAKKYGLPNITQVRTRLQFAEIEEQRFMDWIKEGYENQ